MSHNDKQLSGQQLIAALLLTTIAVKCLKAGAPARKLSPALAIQLARSNRYVGKIRGGQVRHIREIDERRQSLRDQNRWDDRSVLHYGNPVNRQTVDIWDSILLRSS